MLGNQSLSVCESIPTTLFEILGETHSLISCRCLLLFTNMYLKYLGSDGVSTWSVVLIYIWALSCSVQKYLSIIMYNTKCTLGHQNVGVCEVSHAYLLGCLRYGERHAK